MPTATPSTQDGMGARAFQGGVGFRVWAPFAESVSVAGDFNQWSAAANLMASEGNGYWSTDVPGAQVQQEYKFVINPNTANPRPRNDPYAREIHSATGNSVVHPREFDWSGDSFQPPPWNEMVIYELHVGTFHDDPAPGLGIFDTVVSKLDYLRDLGINMIEVMAAGEFATDLSWGYNPAYLFAIESTFGGITGFKAFVKAAHENQIGVIFDVVYNHLGHPAEDLWQFDGWNQDGHGGIYFYNDDRRWTPWGETRLDYGRGEVRQYLRDNADAWLNARHVDGLRWDATAHIRNHKGQNNDPAHDLPDGWSFMQWVNAEIADRNRADNNRKISIAEDLQGNEWLTRDGGGGGAGFGAQWDARFAHAVRTVAAVDRDADRDLHELSEVLRSRYNGDAFRRVIYSESHDEVGGKGYGKLRLPELIWPANADSWFSRKRSTLAASLALTAPGIPMLFQGQEFLAYQMFQDHHPLDWSLLDRHRGIHQLYRDLIRLRRNWHNQTRGLRGQHINVHHVNHSDKLLAYHRWDQGGAGDDVLVVVNLSDRSYDSYTLGFPRFGYWKVRFNSDWSGYGPDFGNHAGYDTTASWGGKDGLPCHGNVGIGPYSVLILSQDG